MKRVFIVCSHPLLAEGIESLIRPIANMQVVGQDRGLAKAIPRLTELRPDAVIVGSDDCEEAAAQLLLHLLSEGLCGKVIHLSLQENMMCVYSGQRRLVGDVSDLVDAIDAK